MFDHKRNVSMLDKTFTGSIDELLAHVSKADPNQVEKEHAIDLNRILSHEEAIELIMKDGDVSREVAEQLYLEIKLEMVTEACESLVKKGYLEIVSYDPKDNFEAQYGLTQKGKDVFGIK